MMNMKLFSQETEALVKTIPKRTPKVQKINYKWEIRKELEELARFPLLNKWKEFILNLCKEKGQEVDIIWFDESAPYDCCVEVRLKGHKCWNSCVSFRFEDNKLKAYDSHFGGGTSFIWLAHTDYLANPNIEQDKVKEIMEKVFKGECCNSFWEKDTNGHREIKLDEYGWIC